MPDGCIDLIWSSHDQAVHVAGPDTRPLEIQLRPSEEFAAVRFRPGAGPAVLGLPASALRDARVPLAEVWGRDAGRIAELVAVASDGLRDQAHLTREVRALSGRPPSLLAA